MRHSGGGLGVVFCAASLLAPLFEARAANLAGVSGKAAFDLKAASWPEERKKRAIEHAALRAYFAKEPAALAQLSHLARTAEEQQGRLAALHKALVGNQDRALKDGVITKETRDAHAGKLDKVLRERLFYIWSGWLPDQWNVLIAGHARGRKKPAGYPFPAFPRAADWELWQSRDFTPYYDPKSKTMTVEKEAR